MTYLVPNDFRTATPLAPACVGLALTTAEASDPQLTEAIFLQSKRLDKLTDDHFEPTNGATIDVSGSDLPFLDLPRRIRTITSVSILNLAGTYDAQGSTLYTVRKSVAGSTWDTVDIVHGEDRLDVAYGQWLTNGYSVWPCVPYGVRIVGNFDWPETPPAIKRALALMVWDSVKPMMDPLHRADRFTTPDLSMSVAAGPTNSAEANEILAEYHRIGPVLIA